MTERCYGHDRGLVITQPKAGQFVERPMTTAELAAREPAGKIQDDIHRHACYAGACYYELWALIAAAVQEGIDAALKETHPEGANRDASAGQSHGADAMCESQGRGGDAAPARTDAPVSSVEQQIECVKREIGMREHVYPRRVADRKMTQALADRELATMRAVLATLEALPKTQPGLF